MIDFISAVAMVVLTEGDIYLPTDILDREADRIDIEATYDYWVAENAREAAECKDERERGAPGD
jgi:hypothetical protein